MEKEVSGLYLSGHPLDAYRAQIAQVSTCTIAQLLGEDAKQFDNQTVTLVCTIVKNKINPYVLRDLSIISGRKVWYNVYGREIVKNLL